MCRTINLAIFLVSVLALEATHATKLSHKESQVFANGAISEGSNVLHVRRTNPMLFSTEPGSKTLEYISLTLCLISKIVEGLLSSKEGKVARYISEIPCDIVNTLVTDVGQAEQFVSQLAAGQVPTLIQDLPQEAVQAFGDVINILTTLPSEIINVAEAAVTDVAKIVNDIEDGQITSDLAALPSEIVAGITQGWGDLTDGLTDAWNGLTNGFKCDILNQCPTAEAGNTCGTPASVSAAATTAHTPVSSTYAQAPATSTFNAAAASSSSAEVASPTQQQTSQSSQTPGFVQSTTPGTTQGTAPSTPQNTTQSQSPNSLAGMTREWATSFILAVAAVAVLGVAV